MSAAIDRDRNLLFGVLAVQLHKATPAQVMEAAGAWATDPSKELSARLVEVGALSPPERDLLDRLVQEAVEAHGGRADAALQTFGGEEQVHVSFCGAVVKKDGGWSLSLTRPLRREDGTIPLDALPAIFEMPGRYELRGEHARGGQGRLLLVQDTQLGREVLLKELLPTEGESTQGAPNLSPVRKSISALARFLQEARVTGQLEHPAIVPVYELGRRSDGTLYYTMKLVRGQTLSEALKKCGELRERLALLPHFIDLCQGMAYAHERGIIHRDLKPSNVMVGQFGETVIIDWGLAKVKGGKDLHADELERTTRVWTPATSPVTDKTEPGEILGTPVYMSPEQARGQVELIDERSDIYSLGVILYQIISGKPPYVLSTIADLLHKVVNEPPLPLLEVEPAAPRELVAICERALQKHPNKRYQTAKELAEDVERFLSGALVRAHEYSYWERVGRFVRKHRGAVGTAALAFVALLVVLGVSYVRILNANEQLTIKNEEALAAKQLAENAEAQAVEEVYFTGIAHTQRCIEVERPGWAQAQLFKTPENLRSWEFGRLLELANLDWLTLTAHEGHVSALAFSPDSKSLATADSEGKLFIWDLAKPGVKHEIKAHNYVINTLAFSPDGQRLATGSSDRTGKIWDVETGHEIAKLSKEGIYFSGVAFSPDGRYLASATNDNLVQLWDGHTGAAIRTFKGHTAPVFDVCFNQDGSRLVSAGHDRTVRLWNTGTGEAIAVLEGHTDTVYSAIFSPDDRFIVSAGLDTTIRAWEHPSLKPAFTLGPHPLRVTSIDFNRQSGTLATACGDGRIRVYSFPSGQLLMTFKGYEKEPGFLAYSPDGRYLAIGAGGGVLRLWPSDGPRPARTFIQHVDAVSDLAISSDGRWMATASDDGTICLTDFESPGRQRFLARHEGAVTSVHFSANAPVLASAGSEGAVILWDVETGVERGRIERAGSLLRRVRLTPDGQRAAVSGARGPVSIWSLPGSRKLHEWPEQTLAEFSPDAARIVTAHFSEPGVTVWSADTFEPIAVLEGVTKKATAIQFSPDGNALIVGSADGTLRVWDPHNLQEITALEGHTAGIHALAFLPGENRLFSAGRESQIFVWDLLRKRLVMSFEAGVEGVAALAVRPDNGELFSAMNSPRVLRLGLYPWRAADYPESGGPDLAARVRTLKTDRFRADFVSSGQGPGAAPPAVLSRLKVLVDRDHLRSTLRSVGSGIKMFGAAWSDEGGLLVTDHPAFDIVYPLGFKPGDAILAVGGMKIDRSEAQVKEAIDQLALEDAPSVEIMVKRRDREVVFVYTPI